MNLSAGLRFATTDTMEVNGKLIGWIDPLSKGLEYHHQALLQIAKHK